MYNVRESWTDERLDDFRGEVNRRFDRVDWEFDKVDKRFDRVGKRFDKVDHELGRVSDRLDGLHKVVIYAILTLGSSTVAGWAAVIALIIART